MSTKHTIKSFFPHSSVAWLSKGCVSYIYCLDELQSIQQYGGIASAGVSCNSFMLLGCKLCDVSHVWKKPLHVSLKARSRIDWKRSSGMQIHCREIVNPPSTFFTVESRLLEPPRSPRDTIIGWRYRGLNQYWNIKSKGHDFWSEQSVSSTLVTLYWL